MNGVGVVTTMVRRRRFGRIGLAAAGVVLLVVLSGCNLAAKVVVQPDGSGSYSVIMTLPNGTPDPGPTIYQAVKKGAAKSDFPMTVTQDHSADGSGAKVTFHFKSLNDLNAESQRLASSGHGGIGVTINRDSTGWHFSASTANTLITAPSSASSSFSGGTISASQLSSLLTIDLVVQLPGAPAANNAKTVTHTATSSTFTWAVTSTPAGSMVQASTTYVGNQANVPLASAVTPVASHPNSGSGSSGMSGETMGLLAGGVVVLGAAAVTATVVSRRRRGGTGPDGGDGSDEPDVGLDTGTPTAPAL